MTSKKTEGNEHQSTHPADLFREMFFLADLVRCWTALPAVYVEHHRFPHAERQVLQLGDLNFCGCSTFGC